MTKFLSGLSVGAFLGICLAPRSGRETRSQLVERAGQLLGRKNDSAENTKQTEPDQVIGKNGSPNAQTAEQSGPQESQDEVAEVLNTASKTKLRSVPGIGEATAKRIIENRPYEAETDVLETKVMSEALLKKLKDKLVDDEVA